MSDDKRLERVEDKVDQIATDISAINVTLSSQHTSLKEHIRRTNLLEAELKPIKTRQDMLLGALKLLASAGAIVALIEAIRLLK